MSNSAAAQEPSMEEILASIRRIITDEESATGSDHKASADNDSMQDQLETDKTDTGDGLLSSSQPMSPDDLDALFAPETEDNEVSAKPQPARTKPVIVQTENTQPAAPEEDAAGDDVIELTAAEIDVDASDLDGSESELIERMDVFFDEVDYDDAPMAEVAPPAEPEPAKEPAARQPSFENLISTEAANSVSASFSNLSKLVVQSQAKTMEDLLKEMLRPMLQSWLDENLPTLVETMVAAEIRRLSGKK